MDWTMYTAIYELRSPLHIGYHKIGNVQRTRYYIPARNLWGAVTEALTRRGFSTAGAPQGDYQQIGEWVKTHCAFGYWFIQENGQLLYPHYEEGKLKYGHLTAADFERRYLDAHVTTALDPSTTSAEEGSLHEVEFIAAYNQDGVQTRVGGWVFLDETALQLLGEESKWSSWLGTLQMGAERRYGFGLMHLIKLDKQVREEGYKLHLDGGRPKIDVKKKCTLLAHADTDGVNGKGMIEPLVGRETDTKNSALFGCKLVQGIICWSPGTILESSYAFEILKDGIWRTTL